MARPRLRAMPSRASSWRSLRPYVRRGGCILVRQAQDEPASLRRGEPSPPLPLTFTSTFALHLSRQRLHLTPLQVQCVVALYGQNKASLVKQRRRTISVNEIIVYPRGYGHSSNTYSLSLHPREVNVSLHRHTSSLSLTVCVWQGAMRQGLFSLTRCTIWSTASTVILRQSAQARSTSRWPRGASHRITRRASFTPR